jgi:hypothetical protein
MMSNKTQGMTLAETLIYCVLLGLFTSVFFVSLPTRGNASIEDLAEAVERTSLALTRLNRGLSNSSPSKVFVRDGGRTLIYLSATDSEHSEFTYDKSGGLLWRQWDYFTFENGQVVHYQIPLDRINTLSEVAQPVENLVKPRDGKPLVRDVSEFQVQKLNSDYRVVLELDVQDSTYGSETLARPRN